MTTVDSLHDRSSTAGQVWIEDLGWAGPGPDLPLSERVDYLQGFSDEVREQACELKQRGVLEERLLLRYPKAHCIQNNALLRAYTHDLKRAHLRSSPPLGKVRYSDKISTLHRAFGLHTYAVRVQGNKLKSSHQIDIASLFKTLPAAFLHMVVVHELAHIRHKNHDKAFYRLCRHIEPSYGRTELDLRLLLFARQR